MRIRGAWFGLKVKSLPRLGGTGNEMEIMECTGHCVISKFLNSFFMMEISFKDNILFRNRRKEEKKQSSLSRELGIHWQCRPDQEFGVNIKGCT